jgi:hypothetical protein
VRHSFHRVRQSRFHTLDGYKPALDRFDAYLESTNPDLEKEKIERIITLLFGKRPAITDLGIAFSETTDLPEPAETQASTPTQRPGGA